MQLHRIGHMFDREIKLNLLPHITLPRGMYTIRVDWMSHDKDNSQYNSAEFNSGESTDVIFGSDVYSVEIWYRCHNSFPKNPMINIHQRIRIDRLILLNLAVKLIK